MTVQQFAVTVTTDILKKGFLVSTPKSHGYRMPAEFEKHRRTWMIWPERSDVWRDNAAHAQHAYTVVAEKIAEFEPVTMCVSQKEWKRARGVLPPTIRVIEMSNNDAWARDQGPIFVVDEYGNVSGVNWRFNAWGELYKPYDHDQLIAKKVLEIEQVERHEGPMVLEGGSIEVDGEGTLITTEECLLNPNRSPDLTRQEIEKNLRDYLGIEKIIWLPRGVYMDSDTGGHIDNLCRFVHPSILVLTWTEDKNDPQYEISNEAFQRLVKEKDTRGRSFIVLKIPQPKPLFRTKKETDGLAVTENTAPRVVGSRLPASYINFYITNGGVLMPVFNDPPRDLGALKILQGIFPYRGVVPIYSREILLGGGNIHCITLQQPLGNGLPRKAGCG